MRGQYFDWVITASFETLFHSSSLILLIDCVQSSYRQRPKMGHNKLHFQLNIFYEVLYPCVSRLIQMAYI
jgi:hypothetical protein